MVLNPMLTQLDQLLANDTLFQVVEADLDKRHPHTLIGDPGRDHSAHAHCQALYGWSYEATEQFVSDSLVLRQFCQVSLERMPDDTALIRWANLTQPPNLARYTRPCS
jgi:transposase, IS5 family